MVCTKSLVAFCSGVSFNSKGIPPVATTFFKKTFIAVVVLSPIFLNISSACKAKFESTFACIFCKMPLKSQPFHVYYTIYLDLL